MRPAVAGAESAPAEPVLIELATAEPAPAARAGRARAAPSPRWPSPPWPSAAPAEPARPTCTTEILRLRLAWLRFAPLTMTGLVVLGVLFGAVIQITNATDINLAATGPVQQVVADFTAFSVVQRLLVGGAIVLLAGYVLIAMVGYIAVFWKFRLAEPGHRARCGSPGACCRSGRPRSRWSRLRGVEISESLLLRAARGARCIAIATGLHVGRGAEREGSVLLPPAPRAVARQVAARRARAG